MSSRIGPAWLRGIALLAGIAGLGWAATLLAGWSAPGYVLLLGAVIGANYGLLSVGLVLIFRTARVINFALTQIGAFAAALLPLLVVIARLPFWVAFVLVALAGAVVGAFVDLTVVKRLADAPRAVVVIATLCVGSLLTSATSGVDSAVTTPEGRALLTPPGLPEFSLGPLLITPDYVALMIFTPVLVGLLTWFLARGRYGLAIRAAAGNPVAARLAGISPMRMSALAWGIAGLIATVTTVFLGSAASSGGADTFGPALLLRALSGAVVARMRSLGRAMAAGILLGVLEQVVLWNQPGSHATDVVIFVVLVVAMLAQRGIESLRGASGSWATVVSWRPLPEGIRGLWPVRHGAKALLVAFVVLTTLIALQDEQTALSMTYVLAGAIVALGVGFVTGLAGELTFGHYAIAGLGGVASMVVIRQTGAPLLGVLAALVVSGLASVLLALPSLRARGLTLTVTSLSFALLLPAVILTAPWLLGKAGIEVPRLIVGGEPLQPGTDYFWVALVAFAVAVFLSWNVWRGGFGRILVATRDNEPAARSFGLPATQARVQAFAIAGLLAGLGGLVFAGGHDVLAADVFSPALSVGVVLAIAIGGMSVMAGAIIGAVWVLGLPVLVAQGAMAQVASYTGVLAVLLITPGGIAHLLEPVREYAVVAVARLCGRRIGVADLRGANHSAPTAETQPLSTGRHHRQSAGIPALVPKTAVERRPGRELLRVEGLTKTYDGIHAVAGVDFTVAEGETVGLIGPNGAGKTTTFEMLGGFVRPSVGRITYLGKDITGLSPRQRVELGLVRSFQDSALFPTMSVVDVLALALEQQRRTNTVLSVLGVDTTARHRRAVAEEIAAYFGLAPYRASQIRELSTGTRRLVELACLISLRPRLLLLDEPSSGIAQRETEALGTLLGTIKRDFATTIVLIEHDIPLVTSVSDRLIAMDCGHVLCAGTPESVRRDPRVVASYLGTSRTAVERSDHPSRRPTANRDGVTR
ncbi:ABC transporter permease subunit [Amycolatopsis pigmentata]|uniref:ATP-binding cassette domain-containing protein n=1 Tax=Amycolatopsis pigmentata TaxID=450801 RepID=A0ABW5G1J9_9PSEU